jgi:hypothetical protein
MKTIILFIMSLNIKLKFFVGNLNLLLIQFFLLPHHQVGNNRDIQIQSVEVDGKKMVYEHFTQFSWKGTSTIKNKCVCIRTQNYTVFKWKSVKTMIFIYVMFRFFIFNSQFSYKKVLFWVFLIFLSKNV